MIRRNSDYSFDDSRIFARDKSNGKTVPYHNPTALLFGYTWRYDYVISPYDPAKFVKVHIDMGNGTSRDRYISLMGISTDAMRYVNDKVRG